MNIIQCACRTEENPEIASNSSSSSSLVGWDLRKKNSDETPFYYTSKRD